MLLRRFVLIVLALLVPVAAFAANENTLPRRGYLGVAMDTKGAAAERGVLVKEIFPGSSAEAAGLQPDDVLLRLNGQAVEGPTRLASVIQTIQKARGGQTLEVTILRRDAEVELPVALKELPRESSPDYETVYDDVDVDGALHRVILTMPRSGGPHPTMFFLQGVSCSSVEFPLTPLDPIRQLIAGVTNEGFATLRVEKSGCGDSQGAPCEEMDFQTETKAYRAAFDYAAKRDGIDAKRIFLFGHSMGGVFAPVLAAERPVAGIIVYGTIGAPLRQYFADNDARQLPMLGYPEAMLKTQLENSAKLFDLFINERLTIAQILERAPELSTFARTRSGDGTHIFGRHYTFWHQLADLNLPSPWAKVNAPVLALWGTSDFPATRADHPLIVDTVNAQHPGMAEFREVGGTGHGFEISPSMADSMRNGMQGEFNPILVTTCVDWMKGVIRKG